MNLQTQYSRPSQGERFLLAEQAESCVRWLKAQGLEVVGIEKSKVDNAIITIKTCELCLRFEGVTSEYQRIKRDNEQIELRFKFVRRMGCMVRWEDEVVQ
jgi:hypothetical protein